MPSTPFIFVTPGQILSTEAGFLKGHGTYVEEVHSSTPTRTRDHEEGVDNIVVERPPDDEGDGSTDPTTSSSTSSSSPSRPAKRVRLISSLSGILQRTSQLISVIPLTSPYTGSVGDLVIGRVTAVQAKRWSVNVGGVKDSSLNLSSVNLPSGVQRIRTYEDSLQMRSIFIEGDLVSAEVQQIQSDNTISLHTRSLRYGKLCNGVLVTVPHALVKRMKQHFLTLPGIQVDVLVGCNGFIWIQRTIPTEWEEEVLQKGEKLDLPKVETLMELRRRHAETANGKAVDDNIVRVKNSILILKSVFRYINATTIMEVYNKSIERQIKLEDMLNPENVVSCSEGTREV
jgi:exosome complex component RRP4